MAVDGSLVFSGAVTERSAHHLNTTYSTTCKRAGGADSPSRRPKNRSKTHNVSSASGVHDLTRALHTADAQCCGYRHAEAHQAPGNVKGLFVTFCNQTTDEIVANAQRELEYEKDMRLRDKHFGEVELTKVIKLLRKAEDDRDRTALDLSTLKAQRDKEVGELMIVRQEYENRWRGANVELDRCRAEIATLRSNMEQQRIEGNIKTHQLDEAHQVVAECKTAVARLEKESSENAQRALLYFEEKRAMHKALQDAHAELQYAKDTLATKELLIRGLDKELIHAHEKLSTVAILRKQVTSRGASTGFTPASESGPPSKLKAKLAAATAPRAAK